MNGWYSTLKLYGTVQRFFCTKEPDQGATIAAGGKALTSYICLCDYFIDSAITVIFILFFFQSPDYCHLHLILLSKSRLLSSSSYSSFKVQITVISILFFFQSPHLWHWDIRIVAERGRERESTGVQEWIDHYSHYSWPMTLNKHLPWTMVWASLPGQLSNTSVQLVWRESVKQLSKTPLNSFKQGTKHLSMNLFMKVSLSPDIILCGWLGSKHQLTNKETAPMRPDTAREKVVNRFLELQPELWRWRLTSELFEPCIRDLASTRHRSLESLDAIAIKTAS